LEDADLTYAFLTGADLRYADLTGADLLGANLWYADLTGADLSGSNFGNVKFYDEATWTDAFYYTDNEPTWHSGMDAAWRSSVGIVQRSSLGAGSPVPEPSTLLLALLGLALLPRRRRQ
ncbi:MAG: pentapeptide repeat-containing protein, partial [Planctomycetota bacterium]|nr:pentapeptide repeat-containing protein [Planctomycetota bacterium]